MIIISHKYICEQLKEDIWSKKFLKVYNQDGWDCWYVTASNIPGVVPHTNVIENMHES